MGAIVGSFLSGFVVLPKLGLQRGIYVAVLGDLILAGVLFAVAPGLPLRRRRAGVAAAVALALLGLVLPRWNLVTFSSGFFRMSVAREYISRTLRKHVWKDPKLVFYEDGTATTVTVDQWDAKTYSLKNNGKVDASNDADMPTQIMVGLLPLLLLRRRRRRPRWRWSASARASRPAPSRSTPSSRWRSSSSSRPSTAPRASSPTTTTARWRTRWSPRASATDGTS